MAEVQVLQEVALEWRELIEAFQEATTAGEAARPWKKQQRWLLKTLRMSVSKSTLSSCARRWSKLHPALTLMPWMQTSLLR